MGFVSPNINRLNIAMLPFIYCVAVALSSLWHHRAIAVTVCLVFAGSLLGVPTLIQEQNRYPGVTTRLLARRASEVHITFEASRRYLKRQDNVKLSGNPVRSAVGAVSRQEGAESFRVRRGHMIGIGAEPRPHQFGIDMCAAPTGTCWSTPRLQAWSALQRPVCPPGVF